MQFKITLQRNSDDGIIPINYQYPLSAAIYKIIQKGDAEYAGFLHGKGYGKGYKFFTFSDIKCPFKIKGDRLQLLQSELEFIVSFHLPEASEKFIKGLFLSQEIIIADYKSKASFTVKSVESLTDPLSGIEKDGIMEAVLNPISILVAGVKNQKGNYDYLPPDHPRFIESLEFNWRKKIEANYNPEIAEKAKLRIAVLYYKKPPRSRLITIKGGKSEETKIRGFNNFQLKVNAEKKFIHLLINCGLGLETAMGCGCMAVETIKKPKHEPV